MKQSKLIVPALLLGMCLISETPAGATVDYQIVNAGGASTESTYSDLQEVNIKIDGNTIDSAFTGGIQISETTKPAVAGLPVSYTTVCTDINGTLYLGGTYSYATPPNTFGTLSGVDPTWGAANGPGVKVNSVANATQAIQNAAYIFYNFGGLTSKGITGTPDQMAGLQLAVWEALYDTTTSGQVVANEGTTQTSATARFQVLAGGDENAITDANAYLKQLNNQPLVGKFGYSGALLVPSPLDQDNSDGEPPQELLIGAPVPEPSTLIAGALMLLPFGASTLRILRRNHAA